MDAKILIIADLIKEYEGNFKLNISELYLEQNKILSIIGPNGSGKSTLLRLIGLLEKPDEGSIIFNGENISDSRADQIRIRKEMVIVFQESVLFNTSEVKEQMDYMIRRVNIEKLLDRSVRNLSGGER